MARSECTEWRVAVEARILELETLVESWRQVGEVVDDSGRGVPPFVSVVGWHVERLRQVFEGAQQ